MWLRDFLPQNLPNARILLFGYNASVGSEASFAGVNEQAENLLNRLQLDAKRKVRAILSVMHIKYEEALVIVTYCWILDIKKTAYRIYLPQSWGIDC